MALTNGKDVTLFHLSSLLCCRKTSSCASCSVWGLLSHCRASGILAVVIYPLFKLAKTGHSDSFLDQVNKYLTSPELYFNVMLHKQQSFPEALPRPARSCLCKLSFRQDDMPVSSHKLFTSTQWAMYHWSSSKHGETCAVRMQCKALHFSHLTQHGIYSPPASFAEDNVSFHLFSWSTFDRHRRIVDRPEGEKVRSLTSKAHCPYWKQEKTWNVERYRWNGNSWLLNVCLSSRMVLEIMFGPAEVDPME